MKVLKCCKLNFMQWRLHPKYLLCALFLVGTMWKLTYGFGKYAAELGCPIHPWIFPLLPGSAYDLFVLMLPFVLIISDAPFRNRQQQFVFQRVGKRNWICGQLLFLFETSVIYTTFLWLLSWVFLIPNLQFDSEWGAVLNTAAQLKEYEAYSSLRIQYGIIKGVSASEAALWVFFMMIAICFLMGEIMIFCNLYLHNGIGVAITSGFLLLAFMVRFNPLARRGLIWISPLSWLDRSLMGNVNQNLPSFEYAVGITLLLCVGLAGIIVGTVHKINLDAIKE